MSAPALLICALLLFGAWHGLVDATSTAIMLPTFVLYGLLAAAANKKRLHPWQNPSDKFTDPLANGTKITAAEESIAQGNSSPYAALFGQCMIYILMPSLASGFINVCNANTNWGKHLPEALVIEIPISILCTVLIAYVLEVILYSIATFRNLKDTAMTAGPLFNTFWVAWILVLLLPAIQFAMYYRSLGAAIDDADTIRTLLGFWISFSTIPITAAALAIALAQHRKSALILEVGFTSVAAICVMSCMFFVCHPSSIYFWRAFPKAMTGSSSGVIDDCTTAIKIDPHLANAYWARGHAYYKLVLQENAISDFSTALSLNPRESEVYYLRAYTYNREGAYQKAISDCSKAILIGPRFKFYLERARAFAGLHQYDNALGDCNCAITLRPEAARGYVRRADVYLKCGQLHKAIADFTRAIELNPTEPEEYAERANAYVKSGQLLLAQLDLRKAVDLGHTNQQAER